jgi:general secretion pathway protein G
MSQKLRQCTIWSNIRFERSRGLNLIAMRNQTIASLIATLVVLATIAGCGDHSDKDRVKTAQTDIRAIQKAVDLFRLDNFKYPTTEQGLEALVKRPPDPTITNYRPGGYLLSVPKDPWGHSYVYQCPGTDGRDYDIISYGRDGKPGGDGFDADISTSAL